MTEDKFSIIPGLSGILRIFGFNKPSSKPSSQEGPAVFRDLLIKKMGALETTQKSYVAAQKDGRFLMIGPGGPEVHTTTGNIMHEPGSIYTQPTAEFQTQISTIV